MNFNNRQDLINDIREWASNDEISYRNWIRPTIILSAGQDLGYFDRISEWQEIIPAVAARYFSCMGLPMSANQVELVLTDEDVEEFGEGVKRLAQADNPKPENPIDGAMNPPEKGRRTRRSAAQAQPDNADTTADETPAVDEQPTGRTRRVRKTR